MRHKFVLAALFSVSDPVRMRNSAARSNSGAAANRRRVSIGLQLVIAPKVADVPAHPLPFKGKLLSGDPAELPPAVAMSLSDNSPVTFTYREELTHDDYHVPLIISAFDPANLVGAPLGDIGVTAFASLSISAGDTVIGDYTAKEHVSKSYNMYSHASHKEVDDAARAAVRQRIDQKLYERRSQVGAGRRQRWQISNRFASANESPAFGILARRRRASSHSDAPSQGQPFEKVYVTAGHRGDLRLPSLQLRLGSDPPRGYMRRGYGAHRPGRLSCVHRSGRREGRLQHRRPTPPTKSNSKPNGAPTTSERNSDGAALTVRAASQSDRHRRGADRDPELRAGT